MLRKYYAARSCSPTLQEVCDDLGCKSVRTATQYLETLERKGYIKRYKNVARNIELLDIDSEGAPNQTISVPVVASVGCDDLSVFANEEYDEYIEVDRGIAENPQEIVAVRAMGDSMVDAGINSGDYILVQFTDNFNNGDRVAAVVNGMVVVKRYERQGRHIVLRPESKDPKYKPIILTEDFKLTGKVLCVITSPSAEMTEVVPLESENRRRWQ